MQIVPNVWRVLLTNVYIPSEGKRPGKFTRRWLVRNMTTGACVGGHFKTKKAAQEQMASSIRSYLLHGE